MRQASTIVLTLVTTLAAAACQPLYGGSAEPTPRVKPIIHAPEIVPPPPPIKYIEVCNGSFHNNPRLFPPAQPTVAAKLAEEADKSMTDAKAKPPQTLAQGEVFATAVDRYANALRKDPYNAEITLRLAIAYDAVYRKGCAILLLKRIAAMTKNPAVSPNAESVAEYVEDNNSLFHDYHKDAVDALKRP